MCFNVNTTQENSPPDRLSSADAVNQSRRSPEECLFIGCGFFVESHNAGKGQRGQSFIEKEMVVQGSAQYP
jgi:hypothetical protein